MTKILATKNNFKLCQDNDLYYVELPEGGTTVNISGTKDEVTKELKRWQEEIDYNNNFMLEVEHTFLEALEDK